jgi:hypothetical protein
MLKIIAVFYLFLVSSVSGAARIANIEINSKSQQRVLCDVRFSKVDDLKVIAKLVPESRIRSRVDIERYSACPYDVRILYKGRSLRIDFSRSVTKELVDNYQLGDDLNTGFFSLDGDEWLINDELIPNPDNKVTVEKTDREILVTGVAHPMPDKGQPAFVCFSVALIRKQGLVTGGLCSPTREEVQVFSRLFSSTRVMSAN